jgi:hypothetical protein
MQVVLKGKTRKGKTRIGMHGPLWTVVQVNMEPRPDEMLVRSQDGRDLRWIHPTADPNFMIVETP